ncbi:MAG: polyamine aminopropyltransferase [Burkholderiales bacterium]|nr:polyamine aminopropyltransferase [Burkholderiales bacterium]
MGLLSRFRTHRVRSRDASVDVSEKDGVRSLHLGSDTIQSSMRVDDPVELVLSYTRSMMAFLLFHPDPRDVVMIGLGGGSLAKFAYHRLPRARVRVVENSAQVIGVARSMFAVPADDARFEVVLDDGASYVRALPVGCDVLMVDAYDGEAQVEDLASEGFYTDACAALSRDGVLVVNLWSSDSRYDAYLQRIERAFGGQVVCLPAERRGNVAVFAFRHRPLLTRWDQLDARARTLETALGLEFRRFVERIREMNPHTDNRLIV